MSIAIGFAFGSCGLCIEDLMRELVLRNAS